MKKGWDLQKNIQNKKNLLFIWVGISVEGLQAS